MRRTSTCEPRKRRKECKHLKKQSQRARHSIETRRPIYMPSRTWRSWLAQESRSCSTMVTQSRSFSWPRKPPKGSYASLLYMMSPRQSVHRVLYKSAQLPPDASLLTPPRSIFPRHRRSRSAKPMSLISLTRFMSGRMITPWPCRSLSATSLLKFLQAGC